MIVLLDVRSLNGLVNTLISKRITKSVLIEFTHTNRVKLKKQNLIEFEQKANVYLKRLYSNMLNRTCLTVIKLIGNSILILKN